MKRGFLGSVDIRQDYWTNGKNSGELKQNETYLYAEIDCCQEYIGIAKNQTEAQTQYNKQDLFYLCLVAISMAEGDKTKLYQYGVVIGNMVSEGRIYRSYFSLEEENAALDKMVDELVVRGYNFKETVQNNDFIDWYNDNVIAMDNEPKMNGIGATSGSDDLSIQAKEGGLYFVYLLNKNEDVFEGGDVQTLREKVLAHENYLDWINSCDVNVTSNSILANARAGIIAKTGMTPEEALSSLKNMKGTNGVGAVIEAGIFAGMTVAQVIVLFSMAASVLAGIVISIIEAVGRVKNERLAIEASRTAQSDDDLNRNAPSPGDYGYEEYRKLMEEYNEAVDKLEFYEGVSNTTIIGGTIGLWALIFGSAIMINRKNHRR